MVGKWEIKTRGENYLFNPFEGDSRSRVTVKDSQLLFVYGGLDKKGKVINPEGYPASPIGNKRSVWGELYLFDAKRLLEVGSADRFALLSQMGTVLYTKYRATLQRSSSANASFARLVINIALNFGFKETIISVDMRNLHWTGLKTTAARGVLQRLHALGIIIYLRGRGTEDKNARSIPMGFVLHPCIQKSINEYMELLGSGKMDLEGLQYIDVKVRTVDV
jgi:hypothetical protein